MMMAMKWVAAALVMTGVVAAAGAQAVPTATANRMVDVAFTYTMGHAGLTTGVNNFWMQGGNAELSAAIWHRLGGAANITGMHVADSGRGVPVNLVTATFGPRYTRVFRRSSQYRLRIFGEGLAGIAMGFSGYYPQPGGDTDSARSLALQVGGGVDYTLTGRMTLRALQASWLRTQLPNATTNLQNTLTLGAGIVVRLR
jgi:hypothetical protein